jgi:hypothetical protein|tara:strand:+ start:149 stop:391 length:243 start_codon:yes stop_codon:yes gene_type:complete
VVALVAALVPEEMALADRSDAPCFWGLAAWAVLPVRVAVRVAAVWAAVRVAEFLGFALDGDLATTVTGPLVFAARAVRDE